jgi:hypothetical protein
MGGHLPPEPCRPGRGLSCHFLSRGDALTRPGLSDALAGLFRAPGGALGVGMGGRGGAGICCLAEAGQDWPGTTRELRAATVPWVSRNLGIP